MFKLYLSISKYFSKIYPIIILDFFRLGESFNGSIVFGLGIKMYRSVVALVVAFLSIVLMGCGKEKLPKNANGEQLYNYYCADCHKESGTGNFLKGVPRNAQTEFSTFEVMKLIKHGNSAKAGMPVFEQLTRQQALLIAAYLKDRL